MARKPWDKRTIETINQYEAFCIYRDMGEKRSLDMVRKLVSGKNAPLVTYWHKTFSWDERAKAYDEYRKKGANYGAMGKTT